MKSTSFAILAAAAVASSALAFPVVEKRTSDVEPIVVQSLQFALAFENLESALYTKGLAHFDDKAFTDAGFSPDVRGRITQIGQHSATYVGLLQGVLGNAAVAPCEYSL